MVRLALSPPAVSEREEAPPAPCPPPTCVVCLGLGSISESSKAQDQYVLLKEVLDELNDEVRLLLSSPACLERDPDAPLPTCRSTRRC